ncbi:MULTISPECIES: DUF3558 domain-containing protein [Streptomyces]|uniref:DUF3558 domain-containing protein n=1 Tax=Streptomyces silvae TaxID=2803812 RepID=A0ABU8A3H6_9ACTN|nr:MULTISPECIES: DUF3558 domain-containing protein [unclassified Streptomyces]MDX3324814.1 DUF3558 domain-containing protein [Streptomyces sp. ME02-6979-3A]MDX3432970.1 DUF3558 domain-containing protein [Streptomyces sp. ME01-18a]RPK40682.1 hypothetical protein EES40_22135 [Streptomyces sp. ADI93-02]WSS76608.1 DUF3558 domain-containing protein [Streptomyces sp. NBC_01174]
MAYVPGVALLVALVAGCSAGSDADDPAADSKPGSPTVSAAPPGKYRTLPESCSAVPRSTLKDLLPGAADLPQEQQDKVYEGTATVTYDTDRKVGCRWKSDAPDASRNLSIDFERVVSYDPAVSDDDRAREVYAKKEDAAALPTSAGVTPSETPGGSASASASASGSGTPSGSPSGISSASPSADPSGSTSGTDPDEDLRPRLLDGLGDAAFLDDALTRAGSTAQHRTVSVVFRTSNVIVTVQYTEQPARVTEVPDSRELQEKAQALARKLDEALSD